MISDINLTVILITCILFLIVERCNTKTQQEHFKYIKLKNDGDLNIWKEDDLKNAVRETIKGPILEKSLNNGKTKIDKIHGNMTTDKFTMDENSIINVTGKHTGHPLQNLTSPKISVGEFEKAVEAESGISFRSYEADEEYGSGIILEDNENGEFRHNAVGIHHGTTSLIRYDNLNAVEDQINIHSKIQIKGAPYEGYNKTTLELTEDMIKRYNALATNPVLNPAWTTDEIWQGLLTQRYNKMVVTFNLGHEADIFINPRTDYWRWTESNTLRPTNITTQLYDSLTNTYIGADTTVSNDMSQGGIGAYFPNLSGDVLVKARPYWYGHALKGMVVETKNCGCDPEKLKFTSNWNGQSMTINRDDEDCNGGTCTVVLTFTPDTRGPWKGDWTKR